MDKTKSFTEFYRSLSSAERDAYAAKAGTTANYIETHLISTPPRKIPRKQLMKGLLEASDGRLNQSDLLGHFYSEQRAS